MKVYFEDKVGSLHESRLVELAFMSTRDVDDILGARVPLPDTSVEEPGLLVIDEDLRMRLSCGAEKINSNKESLSQY